MLTYSLLVTLQSFASLSDFVPISAASLTCLPLPPNSDYIITFVPFVMPSTNVQPWTDYNLSLHRQILSHVSNNPQTHHYSINQYILKALWRLIPHSSALRNLLPSGQLSSKTPNQDIAICHASPLSLWNFIKSNSIWISIFCPPYFSSITSTSN